MSRSNRPTEPVPIDFKTLEALQAGGSDQVRSWPLWIMGALGIAAVTTAITLDHAKPGTIIPSVFLELGAGILLFSFLFWAERRVIRREVQRQTRALVEALTYSEAQMASLKENPDNADFEGRHGPGGVVEAAREFLEAMSEGRYIDGWQLADENWRLCRIQTWLWAVRGPLEMDMRDLEVAAEHLIEEPEESSVWRAFVNAERELFLQAWGDLRNVELGASSARRRIARDHEIVVFAPLGRHSSGFVIHGLTALPRGVRILMHRTDAGYRVATTVADAPPAPGWPPAWWNQNDAALLDLDD